MTQRGWDFNCVWIFQKRLLENTVLKKTHYPYRAIEKDPIDKNKTGVFHIMRLL